MDNYHIIGITRELSKTLPLDINEKQINSIAWVQENNQIINAKCRSGLCEKSQRLIDSLITGCIF